MREELKIRMLAVALMRLARCWPQRRVSALVRLASGSGSQTQEPDAPSTASPEPDVFTKKLQQQTEEELKRILDQQTRPHTEEVRPCLHKHGLRCQPAAPQCLDLWR